jgi:hypothetical protein
LEATSKNEAMSVKFLAQGNNSLPLTHQQLDFTATFKQPFENEY